MFLLTKTFSTSIAITQTYVFECECFPFLTPYDKHQLNFHFKPRVFLR